MAAGDARLIVLATVLHLEPATGYAVRKHLAGQGVEAWGGMSVASVYSVLRTLAGRGLLEEIDDPTGIRGRTRAYRTTPAGRAAFLDLWRSSVETIDPARPVAFHVAVTLTALVPASLFRSALAHRLEQLEGRLAAPAPSPGALPEQVVLATALWRALAEAEAAWLHDALAAAAEPANPLGLLPG